VTWGRLLSAPVFLGLLLFFGIIVVFKLPMICCQRLRAVRWLSVAGLCYYSAGVTATVLLGLEWWVVLLATLAALGGGWLLPDPVSFILSPARRRAVRRAVEFIERQGGPHPLYGMVAVVGSEPGRLVVSVAVETRCIPPGRRFLAVGADGAIEELDFEYVAEAHGVRAQY